MNSELLEGFKSITKFKRKLNWKNVTVSFSILASVLIYLAVINTVNYDDNILAKYWSKYSNTSNYQFFSGGETGVYYKIGQAAEEHSENTRDITIHNNKTSGGSENAIKVLTTPSSFGLVQEETIKKDDYIREHINYVTPMYLERMHVILKINTDRFPQFSKKNSPTLSSNSSEEVLRLFSSSKISSGPVGSGTRIIASYIIEEVNSQITKFNELNPTKTISNKQEIFNIDLAESMKQIQVEGKESALDIVFTIAGAPIKEIGDLFENENYVLISIDPSFVSKINQIHSTNFRLTDFKSNKKGVKGIYKDSENISTLGSYAWLITSLDVPNFDILKMLEIIETEKRTVADNLGIASSSQHHPLDEMMFYEWYESQYSRENLGDLKGLLILLGSTIFTMTIILSFITFISSSFLQSKYFHQIVHLTDCSFPNNKDLQDTNYPVGEKPDDVDLEFARPKILLDQKETISKVVQGIREILLLQDKVNLDFQSSKLTEKSYSFLNKSIAENRNKLQRHLGRRLNEVIEREDSTYCDPKVLDDLRIYHTAGYLTRKDYKDLKKLIKASNGVPKPDVV